MAQTIVVFALVLGAMVVVHEFGHFIVARLFRIRVEVFSVGFGPRIWGLKRGDTDYRLSAIPLGGYVKMAGENLDEQLTGAPDEFMSKPKWQRFCVAVAGPTMNLLTALAIPAAMHMVHYEVLAYLSQPAVVQSVEPGTAADKAGILPGDLITRIGDEMNPTWQDVEDRVLLSPDVDLPVVVKRGNETVELSLRPTVRLVNQEKLGEAGLYPDLGPNTRLFVGSVVQDSPAAAAGLKRGDQLVAVNAKPIEQNFQGIHRVNREVRGSKGQPVTLTVLRDGQTIELTATPRLIDGELRLGFNHDLRGADRIVTRLGLFQALGESYRTNIRTLRLIRDALAQVFSGARSVRDTFTGPVGIFVLTGQAAERGAASVLGLMAMLSLTLGVINLLPIPVLDGGLIFMLGLEAVLGRFGLPLTLKIKERLMQVGFVVIVLLMAFVIYNDISKLVPSRDAPQTVEQKPGDK